MPNPREEICRIAYEESVKGIAVQETTLSSLRQVSAALGTVSGAAAIFLGKEVLAKGDSPTLWIWTGFLAFIAVVVLVVLTQLPRRDWRFHMSAASIISQFANAAPPKNMETTYEVLAFYNEKNYALNANILNGLVILQYFAFIFIIAQIAAWLFALAK
jgi:hypothetical protein